MVTGFRLCSVADHASEAPSFPLGAHWGVLTTYSLSCVSTSTGALILSDFWAVS